MRTGVYHLPENTQDIAIVDDFAYIATSGHGLQFIDIADPTNPKKIGSFDREGSIHSVDVVGTLAFIIGSLDLRIIDISDPTRPIVLATYPNLTSVEDITVDDKYIYVIDKEAGPRILYYFESQRSYFPYINWSDAFTLKYGAHEW